MTAIKQSPTKSRASLVTAVLLLLAATLSWGGMFPVAKPAFALMDPFYMTLLRFLPAVPVFLIILVVVEGPSALRLEGRLLLLLGLATIGFAGFNLLSYGGLTHSRPEHGTVVLALMPMISVLMSWLLHGQKPDNFTLYSVLVAFLGVFLVITGGNPIAAFSGGSALWDLLFLAGAFCWVSYTMGAQCFPSWSPLRYTAITCAFGILPIGIITLALTLGGHIQLPELNTLVTLKWTLAYLVGPGAIIAVLSWNTGIRILGAINGVLFMNFVPVTAFTIGALQGNPIGTLEILGALLVIGSLIANNLYLRKQKAFTAVGSTAG